MSTPNPCPTVNAKLSTPILPFALALTAICLLPLTAWGGPFHRIHGGNVIEIPVAPDQVAIHQSDLDVVESSFPTSPLKLAEWHAVGGGEARTLATRVLEAGAQYVSPVLIDRQGDQMIVLPGLVVALSRDSDTGAIDSIADLFVGFGPPQRKRDHTPEYVFEYKGKNGFDVLDTITALMETSSVQRAEPRRLFRPSTGEVETIIPKIPSDGDGPGFLSHQAVREIRSEMFPGILAHLKDIPAGMELTLDSVERPTLLARAMHHDAYMRAIEEGLKSVPGSYIVRFDEDYFPYVFRDDTGRIRERVDEEGFTLSARAVAIMDEVGGVVYTTWSHAIAGFSAIMSEEQAAVVEEHPMIRSVSRNSFGTWAGFSPAIDGGSAPRAIGGYHYVGGGLHLTDWIGPIYTKEEFGGWVNSRDHGWIFIYDGEPDFGMWFWDPVIESHAYTAAGIYPHIFTYGAGWTYFSPVASNHITRWFYLYEAESYQAFNLVRGPLQDR